MEKKMYPITYKGKKWNEDDCDPLFVDLYFEPEALNKDKSIYLGDGMVVYPDGEIDVEK